MIILFFFLFFFFHDTATTEIYTFPYTTLFRSSRHGGPGLFGLFGKTGQRLDRHKRQRLARRSEEHTSELQSHHDLVCRLLLEKKKNKINKKIQKKIKNPYKEQHKTTLTQIVPL